MGGHAARHNVEHWIVREEVEESAWDGWGGN